MKVNGSLEEPTMLIFPFQIPPRMHNALQCRICRSGPFRAVYTLVTHDHTPTDQKLLLHWTSWPKRLSFAAIFGLLFKMGPSR